MGDRVTLQTLADRLGVSRTTASNAFNRPDQLNPALREKVLALAAELGYAGPDPAGRALRSGRAGAIGVLLTERLSYAFADPAAVATLRGLAVEAEQFGISLSLLPAPLSDGVADPAAVRHALVDACFVYALPADHPSVDRRARAAAAARRLRHAAHPRRAVRLDRRPRRRARRGAAPARPRPPAARGRLAADAGRRAPRLRRRRPPLRPRLPRHRRAARRLRGGARRRRAGLGRGPDLRGQRQRPHARPRGGPRPARAPPDGDPRHVRRARARRRRRRPAPPASSVPGELSVVGFDDAPPAEPRGLTTVRQPLVQKGRSAGRMLLEAIEGGTPADVLLPTELVIRDSTLNPPQRGQTP